MVNLVKKIRRAARRYYGKARRKASAMTIPIAPIAGILGASAVQSAINNIKLGHWEAIPGNMATLIGVDSEGKFYLPALIQNMTPIVAGMVVHKLANKVGINRALASAKVPFLRV